MLNKSQAEVVADTMLAGERAGKKRAGNARAKRIPWYLRSSELALLSPYRQAEFVYAANQQVRWSYFFYGTLILLLAVFVVAWHWMPRNLVALFVPSFLGCAFIIRTVFVRRELAILLSGPPEI